MYFRKYRNFIKSNTFEHPSQIPWLSPQSDHFYTYRKLVDPSRRRLSIYRSHIEILYDLYKPARTGEGACTEVKSDTFFTDLDNRCFEMLPKFVL